MVWLLVALSIYAVIFVAGRAHSRYLDRLEARLNMVVEIQLLIVSPEMIKQIEPLTLAENHELMIDSLSRVVARNQVLAGASTPGRLTVEASGKANCPRSTLPAAALQALRSQHHSEGDAGTPLRVNAQAVLLMP
jgi:hypothetical protein